MAAYSQVFVKDKPLYCFKYNEETGHVSRIVIPEYLVKENYWTHRIAYCFEKPLINKSDTHYVISHEKLDRFVSNKVYTFNPDIENAKKIILEEMETKTNKYYNLYIRWQDKEEQFLKVNK